MKTYEPKNLEFLEPFFEAYMECATWAEEETIGDREIAEADKLQCRRECAEFLMLSEGHIDTWELARQAGYDFWLNRNGHGAGFWDGYWPEPASKLLDTLATEQGERDLYVTDEGTVGVSPNKGHEELSAQVQEDLADWLAQKWNHLAIEDVESYGHLELTVATNDEGTQWSYQTGDNSFVGGAYLLPHWAVVTLDRESKYLAVLEDIFTQLEELMP